MRVPMSAVLRNLRLFAVAFLLVVLMLPFLENRLIFFPSREPYVSWTPPTPGGEDVAFVAADGTQLVGWYMPHPEPTAVVLFMNGNGGNLTHWREAFATMHRRCRTTIFGFDYRGYGRSEGSPSGAGILQDAQAARKWVAERTGLAENRIVLMGRSIGGAVAIDLAQDGARAVVVESAFTSLPDVAANIFPWLPVRYVMRTRFNSLAKIANYRGPLFVSHGDADELVPYAMGRALYAAAPSSLKRFFTVPGGNHNDPQPPDYYDELASFLAELP